MGSKHTRASTGDRGPPLGTVRVHTVEQIGPKRRLLPNGSLLCEDVPIARTGWMLYGAGEIPLQAGPTGVIYVERTADVLFRPETIGSFMGSPIVDNHPQTTDGVTPDNWAQLAGGFSTTNVRRGEGPDADVLLADIIITRKTLIQAVNDGKREVSIGYDADYEQTEPGMGLQSNIIGNHIALVEKGRCGPRCAIGDHAHLSTPAKENTMTATVKQPATGKRRHLDVATLDALGTLVDKARAELGGPGDDEEGGDEEGSGVHVHIHNGTQREEKPPVKTADAAAEERFVKIETTLGTLPTMIADAVKAALPGGAAAVVPPAGDLTGDSAALETSYKDVQAKCEILVPGFKVPTFDAATPRKTTVDKMCAQRRKALELFAVTKDGGAIIASIVGADADLEKMDCAGAALLFNAAAAQKAASNNRSATGDAGSLPALADARPSVTIAGMNKSAADFWAAQRTK